MTTITFKAIGLTFHACVKATAFIPARVCCLPEDSSPAEGGEIEEWESFEVETKQTIDGREATVLVDCMWFMQSDLCEQLEDAAYEALSEIDYDMQDF